MERSPGRNPEDSQRVFPPQEPERLRTFARSMLKQWHSTNAQREANRGFGLAEMPRCWGETADPSANADAKHPKSSRFYRFPHEKPLLPGLIVSQAVPCPTGKFHSKETDATSGSESDACRHGGPGVPSGRRDLWEPRESAIGDSRCRTALGGIWIGT